MLSKKILKTTVSLALTASVALLAGCPTPGTTPTPTATPDGSAAPSEEPTATPTPDGTATPEPGDTSEPSASPTPSVPTSSTNPNNPTGSNPDISTLATFNGRVFDVNGSPVEGATVSARSIDPGVEWVGEAQQTLGGAYVFRNAPVGARIEITATKAGFTTRTIVDVLKSNLTGNPDANRYDFSGIYAIQDEPQVTSLKINGVEVDRSGRANILGAGTDYIDLTSNGGTMASVNTDFNRGQLYPRSALNAGATGIGRDKLEVEMTFSEPVIRLSVQNNLKLFSEISSRLGAGKEFSVDSNYAGVTFDWSDDDTKVVMRADKPLWTTKDSDEARYTLTFERPFEDKGNTEAKIIEGAGLVANPYKFGFFRFSNTNQNDFATFSVQRDTVKPVLTSISALDNRGDEDILILNFSEPLDVINKRSPGVDLFEGGAATRQLTNQASFTQLGMDGLVTYSVTRVNSSGTNPTPLGVGSIKNARLSNDGRQLTLTFADTAFDRNERVIVSVGNTIKDYNNSFGVGGNGDLSAGTDLGLTDPAGNDFSDSNETTSSGVTVNDKQKVVTAAG